MNLMGLSLTSLSLSGQQGINIWPFVGILAILLVAFIASRFVRGDPYYDWNVSRDRRDTGAAPMPFDDDGGGNGNGNGNGGGG